MVKGLHRIPDMVKSLYIYIYIGCAALSLISCFLGTTPVSASESITTNVSVEPSLTLSLSASSLALNLDPSITTFGYKDLDVIVGTNNATGYKLTMSTTSGDTNLVNTEDNTKVIETLPTLAGGYTDSTFIVNKWGYKKNRNTDNYNSFPATQTLLENDERTNQDIANLRFGTKIDYLQESGTYATELQFTVTANPTITINDLTYMQDFATLTANDKTAVLNSMGEETTYSLKDKRDEKSYTIAKLKDGNVWMTSNLNIAGGTALYSDDSDVDPANTRASGVAYYTLPNSSSSGFSSDTVAYVYNTGNETTSQAGCTSTQACNSYYSWLAATAGGKDASGTAVTGDGPDAAYSICPKGWRLPKSGSQSDTSATSTTGYKKGDFYKLATAYGANLESSYYQSSAVFYNNAGPGTLPNFLLAGRYLSSTFLHGGANGDYWSSSSISSTNAYDLLFNSSLVTAAGYYDRRLGFPVRCIAK